MEQLIETITRQLPNLSPKMRRAANHILDNPGAIAVSSMRAMAGEAQVSPPTMLRFAKRLGFKNYEAFREIFKNRYTGMGYGDRVEDLRRSMDMEGVPGLVKNTAMAAVLGIERFHDPVFALGVERICDIVMKAPKTYVVASGGSFGQAVSFHYVCKMALPNIEIAAGPGIGIIDSLVSLKKNDAVIAITTSPYARPTIEAAMFAKSRDAKITAVTDRRSSPIGRISDAAVIINTHSPHFFPSMVALNATLEALSAAIAAKRGATAVAAISDHEMAFRENGYYWDEEF